ncbi:MAG: PP2C family protein-serine/threonine phosphatase [Terracidiphilus sp.]
MGTPALTLARIDLAYVALGTVFVFFGLVSCAIAAIRRRGEVRVLVWLGIWSAMYGVSLLLRTPTVRQVLPNWTVFWAPFTVNAIRFLLIVAAMLVWSELTLGKMRRLSQAIAIVGAALAIAGIVWFMFKGLDDSLLPYNNFIAVCAVTSLAVVVVVPSLSSRFLAFPNRVLTVGTLVFTADALFRNVWGWLRLPRVDLPLLDELAFGVFLFSFAYVAAQKVFASERRLLSIENELDVARQIQTSILPTGTPEVDGLRIAASYLPMTAVGGDFYEFVQIDERHVGFLMADVSGHGVPAALIAAMFKAAMQSVISCANEPPEVLHVLNHILSGQLRGQFITAAYLWLDMEARVGIYSAAGHPPLLRWRAGALERIECNGILFGVMPDPDYPVCALPLREGDRFLLYTDGAVEPENAAAESFGDHALDRVLRDNETCPPADLLKNLHAEIRRWQPSTSAQQDDITLIAIDVL